MKSPYYPTAQITLERSLPNNLFVTLAYDINRGIRAFRARDINAPLPGTGIRPLPDEGQIVQYQSSGLTQHQHLKATLRQRFSIFNVSANYTYYHGVGDQNTGSALSLPTNSYDVRQDWGRLNNPRHTFSASVNSRLPSDVFLTTTLNARSGDFYTITTGKDDNRDGAINDRPPGIPKNSEVGPHYFNVSFNFSKAFELNRTASQGGPNSSTGPQMNVFANLNNALNMTHPGTPSGVMTSPFFRKSYNATSPREIEVGMRFQF